MPAAPTHPVRPGGLSEADRERIVELSGRGLKAGRIARAIEKHPSTVQWFLYRAGLMAPRYRVGPFVRGGRLCKPFGPEEDAFIEACRCEGIAPSRIAVLASARFGHARSPHTVRARLVMLAARDDAEVA